MIDGYEGEITILCGCFTPLQPILDSLSVKRIFEDAKEGYRKEYPKRHRDVFVVMRMFIEEKEKEIQEDDYYAKDSIYDYSLSDYLKFAQNVRERNVYITTLSDFLYQYINFLNDSYNIIKVYEGDEDYGVGYAIENPNPFTLDIKKLNKLRQVYKSAEDMEIIINKCLEPYKIDKEVFFEFMTGDVTLCN